MPVRVRRIEDIGRYKIVRVALGELPLNIVAPEEARIAGDEARIRFDPDQVHVYADGHLVEGEAA